MNAYDAKFINDNILKNKKEDDMNKIKKEAGLIKGLGETSQYTLDGNGRPFGGQGAPRPRTCGPDGRPFGGQ
jgi:hypothetical protein